MWLTYSYVSFIKNIFELEILVSGMSTVWEDTGGCYKQYRCDLDIYLIPLLSSSYGIIIDRAINTPDHVKNVVDGLNTTEKSYLN